MNNAWKTGCDKACVKLHELYSFHSFLEEPPAHTFLMASMSLVTASWVTDLSLYAKRHVWCQRRTPTTLWMFIVGRHSWRKPLLFYQTDLLFFFRPLRSAIFHDGLPGRNLSLSRSDFWLCCHPTLLSNHAEHQATRQKLHSFAVIGTTLPGIKSTTFRLQSRYSNHWATTDGQLEGCVIEIKTNLSKVLNVTAERHFLQ